jgi:hypothetical protein
MDAVSRGGADGAGAAVHVESGHTATPRKADQQAVAKASAGRGPGHDTAVSSQWRPSPGP